MARAKRALLDRTFVPIMTALKPWCQSHSPLRLIFKSASSLVAASGRAIESVPEGQLTACADFLYSVPHPSELVRHGKQVGRKQLEEQGVNDSWRLRQSAGAFRAMAPFEVAASREAMNSSVQRNR